MIHIGPPKTGSTSIQTTMAARRDELAELGVLYPGSGVRAKFSGWAVMGVRQRGMRKPRMVEWDELVTEVNGSGLRAVVSSEAFARADEDAVDRIVDSFGADRIHVVAIGRRLDKTLPSLYQEKVKKYPREDLRGVARRRSSTGDDLDVAPEVVPTGTAAGRDRRAVGAPHRSAAVPPDLRPRGRPGHDAAILRAAAEPPRRLPRAGESLNESLDRTSVEMLRQLNEHKRQQQWPDSFYRKLIFDGAVDGLRHRSWGPGDEKVPTPPEWALARVRTLADHIIARLHTLQPHVIGDLGRAASGRGRGGPRQPAASRLPRSRWTRPSPRSRESWALPGEPSRARWPAPRTSSTRGPIPDKGRGSQTRAA